MGNSLVLHIPTAPDFHIFNMHLRLTADFHIISACLGSYACKQQQDWFQWLLISTFFLSPFQYVVGNIVWQLLLILKNLL